MLVQYKERKQDKGMAITLSLHNNTDTECNNISLYYLSDLDSWCISLLVCVTCTIM